MSEAPVPVIAIDGPSASGKGTVAERVARELGWHYLDSGALYRLVAVAAARAGLSLDDEGRLAETCAAMTIEFRDGKAWLDGIDASEDLRSEATGIAASKVAAYPRVRTVLLTRQRGFRRLPGLVADGRDMGSVVFPEARLKVFLTAALPVRAERRHKQLMEKGMYAKMPDVVEDLRRRDERDATRPVAPLRHYSDALFLDTSGMTADAAVATILGWWRERSEP
ncbi:(d)CMP kinase [Usitatibacter palustris]|uniref:Cytidylate kinase n=1 Tax=Usitatibacter palustris TaxID=2732487 RepID=A0A6M4HAT3_9PROT|nr:(d)CMP kinase [Usitatibacter palustris]QJR15544.1 Cytidylate kinase [Usitatibacter palustris]